MSLSNAELAEVRQWLDLNDTRQAQPQASVREALARAYSQVAEHPAGAIVLRDLFGACGVLSSPQVHGDPYATHVNIGRHQIGLHLMERLRWSATELGALNERMSEDLLRRLAGDGPGETADTETGEGE